MICHKFKVKRDWMIIRNSYEIRWENISLVQDIALEHMKTIMTNWWQNLFGVKDKLQRPEKFEADILTRINFHFICVEKLGDLWFFFIKRIILEIVTRFINEIIYNLILLFLSILGSRFWSCMMVAIIFSIQMIFRGVRMWHFLL